MENDASLSCSKEPATCPYSESDKPTPRPPSYVLMIHYPPIYA